MAYTKMLQIKRQSTAGAGGSAHLQRSLDYIQDEKKTEPHLVSGYNVEPSLAAAEFSMTAAMARKVKGDRTNTGGADVLAHHLVQSFSPKDKLTPEQAHAIGRQLADELLGGRHEYVIATHQDNGQLHNHIIFNATSFYDYKKFRVQKGTARQIREISDRLCAEHGLYVIPRVKGQKQPTRKWAGWEKKLLATQRRLDDAILEASDFASFKALLEKRGITVKEGKHISFRLPGATKFIRGKTIGEEYTREAIEQRIADPDKWLRPRKHETVQTAVRRRTRSEIRGDVRHLAATLMTARREGVIYLSDFGPAVDRLAQTHQETLDKIAVLEKKNQEYKAAATALAAYQEGREIQQKIEAQENPIVRRSMEYKHKAELAAFAVAADRLRKLGIHTDVDLDKVLAMMNTQDEQVNQLNTAAGEVKRRIDALQTARRTVEMTIDERRQVVQKNRSR